ncbi:U-box domain-containing protein 32 isoform X2 [Medicago truncatula]|uniref:RING-type E3 ubiquitin transferase n=1 Tax=Medicago truncatula TaxID=3880 RepID=A0A072W047_MEDTR|nr:U-box domain-containing protein 32 isoform X2 [Medicago truncatula]KEH43690.1 tyrosine kinase family protein [Medicago truncatula]
MGSIQEAVSITEERVKGVEENDTVYVAVGLNAEKNKKLLHWTTHKFSGNSICLLHIHQPDLVNSFSKAETNVFEYEPKDHATKAFQEHGSQTVHELLDKYILTLVPAGASKLLIEKDDIEKGIIEAIAQHNIRCLVMGAAADRHKMGVDSENTPGIVTAPVVLMLDSNTEAKQSEKIKSELIPDVLKYLDSSDMEETENGNSRCSLNAEWSFNSVIARTKLTDLLVHEDDEELQNWRAKEISCRKEVEVQLAREKQDVQEMKNQRDKIICELQMVQDQSSTLRNQMLESKCMVTELEEKIISAVDLLISFKEKRDKLRIEHANAVRKVEVLRKFGEVDTTSSYVVEFPAFSFMEINEATQDFDQSWKIGEGRYGSVYKGLLRNMPVAIKMLPSYGCQNQLEFQHQVEVLSRVRHPNLLTLIGSCAESKSLVYEYLNNGSLESHLACKDRTPLPWQIRISIATDICSALIFLQSSKPCIIHGNLKPSKVLLDANFVAKLGDLGIPSLVQHSMDSADTGTVVCNNSHKHLAYVDPECLVTGKFTPESDVYSFGIILLQLLTGRPLSGLVRDMKCALEMENLKTVLDFSAGEWPLHQTTQLAYLALRCCEKTWLNRPDLVSEIWSVLKPFRTICIDRRQELTSKKLQRAPSHFVCPIVQEVMEDPYIAADGFTYEEEAIRGWLDSGHNTSPMTNLKLEHTDLVPNYALHNAILEWQQL